MDHAIEELVNQDKQIDEKGKHLTDFLSFIKTEHEKLSIERLSLDFDNKYNHFDDRIKCFKDEMKYFIIIVLGMARKIGLTPNEIMAMPVLDGKWYMSDTQFIINEMKKISSALKDVAQIIHELFTDADYLAAKQCLTDHLSC